MSDLTRAQARLLWALSHAGFLRVLSPGERRMARTLEKQGLVEWSWRTSGALHITKAGRKALLAHPTLAYKRRPRR